MAAASVGEMAWVPILEEGVFRFDASEDARVAAGPSLSFADPRRREVQRDGGDRPSLLPACEVVAGNVQKVVIKVRVRGSLKTR
jgi:alpha-glucosidase